MICGIQGVFLSVTHGQFSYSSRVQVGSSQVSGRFNSLNQTYQTGRVHVVIQSVCLGSFLLLGSVQSISGQVIFRDHVVSDWVYCRFGSSLSRFRLVVMGL